MMLQQASSTRSSSRRAEPATKILLGIVLIAAGIVLTLLNVGVIEAEQVTRLWPVIPIAVGLTFLACPDANRGLVRGLIGLCIGTLAVILMLDLLGLVAHLDIDLPGLIPVLVIG